MGELRSTYKSRVLVGSRAENGTITPATVTADSYLPAWPTVGGEATRLIFAGDMRGASIKQIETRISGLTTITTVDTIIQQSEDGVTWHDWKTIAQQTADGNLVTHLDNDDPRPMRFLRAYINVDQAGTMSYTVLLHYVQCGPRGDLAPPGRGVSYN